MADIGLDDDPGALDIEELLSRVRAECAAQASVAGVATPQTVTIRAGERLP